MDYNMLTRVLAAFEEGGVQYAVFGAVAMSLHGLARNTEDLDVFVAPYPPNLERVKAALRSVIADPEIDTIDVAELMGEYPAVRYIPPEGDFYIDIVTRLGEAFAFTDLGIARVPFEGFTVSVVTPETLYRMKKGTVRAKDRIDAEWLRRTFDVEQG
ncbi:MAG: nucleotidyl transferase AbiEii/AbiGii toxin family protein [Acidobacteriota bacterium]